MYRVRIIHKGLILVAVPLVFCLVFVSLLCTGLSEANGVVQNEQLFNHSINELQTILVTGMIGSALITIALAVFFCRNITNRILVIVNNTINLSKGAPLTLPMKGHDEIAELDQCIFNAATEIRELERFKKEMIGVVSHELKSPLSSVEMFLTSLRSGVFGPLNNNAVTTVDRTHRSVVRLMDLVKDLLFLDRLDHQTNMERFNSDELITTSVDTVRELADKFNIEIDVHKSGAKVFGDRNRIIQVIVNLLSNAIKFSPPWSKVVVSTYNKDGWFVCKVTDQGSGIPEEVQENIFQPFTQIDGRAQSQAKCKGTGLGLTISRSIVEQHGGKIGVESIEGSSSTFWFKIPDSAAPGKQTCRSVSPRSHKRARIHSRRFVLPQPVSSARKIGTFSVLQQGLIIIAIPLVFQMMFASVIGSLLYQLRDHAIHHLSSSVEIALACGVALNFTLSIGSALHLIGNFTNRLHHVMENTRRMVKREELELPMTGKDEIAFLDKVLYETAKQLFELEAFKHELISIVSHELRTPLLSICSALELFQSGAMGELSSKARNRLAIAQEEASRLIRLINDLLDIEKMEAGKFNLNICDLKAAELVKDSTAAVAALAESKNISIEPYCRNSNMILHADRDRINQVLINLLSNAIKFSPKNSAIKLVVERIGFDIEFRIIDKGRGIPEHQLDRIFERFFQVQAADAVEHGGSGLGLAIAKAIVDQHGGIIGVQSISGVGSSFWFRLPAAEMDSKIIRMYNKASNLVPAIFKQAQPANGVFQSNGSAASPAR